MGRCSTCKYWVRFETGCYYGTCLRKLQTHFSATTFEDDSCEEFEWKEEDKASKPEQGEEKVKEVGGNDV